MLCDYYAPHQHNQGLSVTVIANITIYKIEYSSVSYYETFLWLTGYEWMMMMINDCVE